ncbi:MAG: phosphopantetheine-binding protein [Rhodopseudomonas palustris]|nr:phosphopantetheine-binding protein [Rhodopseudomonas palustris]
MPHNTLEEDIAAAIVPKEHVSVTEEEVRNFAAARLAEFKVPRQVLILEEIPKGQPEKTTAYWFGKKLADRLALRLQDNFIAPQTPTEEALAEMEKVLRVDRVGVRDDFYSLGGDSLASMMLFLDIANRFKMTIPIDRFLKSPTIDNLAQLLRQEERSTDPFDRRGFSVNPVSKRLPVYWA